MVYAYVRVSTEQQNLENQMIEIMKFCKRKNLSIDEWIEDKISGTKKPEMRQLGKVLMKKVKRGDTIICTELSRLGRSLIMIMNLLNQFLEAGVNIITIKDNFTLCDDIQSKVVAFAFGLSAEIERNLISERTKMGLEKARLSGKKIGRPKGRETSHHKLDAYNDYIKKEIILGRSKRSLAKELHVTRRTLDVHLARIMFVKTEKDKN